MFTFFGSITRNLMKARSFWVYLGGGQCKERQKRSSCRCICFVNMLWFFNRASMTFLFLYILYCLFYILHFSAKFRHLLWWYLDFHSAITVNYVILIELLTWISWRSYDTNRLHLLHFIKNCEPVESTLKKN